MADGAYGRWAIARTYALIFGVAYLGVAATVAITQDALEPVLEFTAIQNAIHGPWERSCSCRSSAVRPRRSSWPA
jgi:hypothetical protein